MASFNRVILIGNLCRDPEVKKTPQGLSVADMRLAVNEVFKNRAGDRTERTCYVDVNAWSQLADLCGQYLRKGSPIFVEGRLQSDEWKTPQGEARSRLRVMAERIQFLSARTSSESSEQQPSAAPARPAAPATPIAPAPAVPPQTTDPLPFDPNEEPPF